MTDVTQTSGAVIATYRGNNMKHSTDFVAIMDRELVILAVQTVGTLVVLESILIWWLS